MNSGHRTDLYDTWVDEWQYRIVLQHSSDLPNDPSVAISVIVPLGIWKVTLYDDRGTV